MKKIFLSILLFSFVVSAQMINSVGTNTKYYQIHPQDTTGNPGLFVGVPRDSSRYAVQLLNGGQMGSRTFLNGWQSGEGWKLAYDDTTKEYTLITDNLIIRGTMQVYEFLINQIRGQNGNLLVTSTGKVDTTNDYFWRLPLTALWFRTDSASTNNISPFQHGDILMCQRIDASGVTYDANGDVVINDFLTKRLVFKVDSVNGLKVYPSLLTGAPTNKSRIEKGDVFVRLGNDSDVTRQGMVGVYADEPGSPYIRITADVNSWAAWKSASNMKVQIGNLDEIQKPNGDTLSGYGVYANRFYFFANDSNYISWDGTTFESVINGINMGTEFIQNDSLIALKANKTYADSINAVVVVDSARITTNANNISLRVLTTTFTDSITAHRDSLTAHRGRISTAESGIEINTDSIGIFSTRTLATNDSIGVHRSGINVFTDSIGIFSTRSLVANDSITSHRSGININTDSVNIFSTRTLATKDSVTIHRSEINANTSGILLKVSTTTFNDSLTAHRDTLTAHRARLVNAESGIAIATDSVGIFSTRTLAANDSIIAHRAVINTNSDNILLKVNTTVFADSMTAHRDTLTAHRVRLTSVESGVSIASDSVGIFSTRTLATKDSITIHRGEINTNTSGILLKVSSTVFNDSLSAHRDSITAHRGRLTTVESGIAIANDSVGIFSTRTLATNDSITTHRSRLNVTADSITSIVTVNNNQADSLTSHNSRINQTVSDISLAVIETNHVKDSISTHRSEINVNTSGIKLKADSSVTNRYGDTLTTHRSEINVTKDSISLLSTRSISQGGYITSYGTAITNNANAILLKADSATTNKYGDTLTVHRSEINTNSTNIGLAVGETNKVKDSVTTHRSAINLNKDSINTFSTRTINTNDSITVHRGEINTNASSILLKVSTTTFADSMAAHRDTLTAHRLRLNSAESGIAIATDSVGIFSTRTRATNDSIVTHRGEINTNISNILLRVSTTTFADSLTAHRDSITAHRGRLTTAESGIQINTDSVNVFSTRTLSANDSITTHRSALNVATDNIALRVTTTVFGDSLSTHRGRLNSAEGAITVNSDSIGILSTRSITQGSYITTYGTSITDNANAILLKADSATTNKYGDTLTSHNSRILTAMDSVNLRVASRNYNGEEIASKINLSSASVVIESPHIQFNGYSIFKALNGNGDSLTINNGKLTAKSVTVNEINVYSISADSLNAKHLISDSVRSTWVYAGTLTAGQVNAVNVIADSLVANAYLITPKGNIGGWNIGTDGIWNGRTSFTDDANAGTFIGQAGIAMGNSGAAKILLSADGSGYVANNHISWNAAGDVSFTDTITSTATIIGSKIQTGTTGQRVVIDTASGGVITFYDANGGSNSLYGSTTGNLYTTGGFHANNGLSTAGDITLGITFKVRDSYLGVDPKVFLSLDPSNYYSNVGITIGGDANLYRPSANVLKSDDTLNAAQLQINGVNLASIYSPLAGSSSLTTAGTLTAASLTLNGALSMGSNTIGCGAITSSGNIISTATTGSNYVMAPFSIGTTALGATLDVRGTVTSGTKLLGIGNTTDSYQYLTLFSSGNLASSYTLNTSGVLNLGSNATDKVYSLTATGGALLATATGNVGIGTFIPRKLADFLSTSQAQLRLSYTDNAVYNDFTTGSGGVLTVVSSAGGTITFPSATTGTVALTSQLGAMHTQNTDTKIDSGGVNEITAANIKIAYDRSTKLVADSTGWNTALTNSHVQNTDISTTSSSFIINSASSQGKIRLNMNQTVSGNYILDLQNEILTNNRTITFPDTTGNIPVGDGTTNQITYWTSGRTLSALSTSTYPSLTELSYVKGVSSSVQSQLGAKLDTTNATLALRTNWNTAFSNTHLQNTDGYLDFGGANAISASQAKTAYTNNHVQNTDVSTSSNSFVVGSGSGAGASKIALGTAANTVSFTTTLQPSVTGADVAITFPATTGTVALTSQLHTQNTDNGTTSEQFTVGSSSTTGKILFQINNGGGNYTTTIDQSPGVASNITLSFPPVAGTLASGTGTANQIAYWSATNVLSALTTATYPSLTELSYVKGLSSAIQTQLGAKKDTTYLSGLSSNVQAQLNAKAALSHSIDSHSNVNIGTYANGDLLVYKTDDSMWHNYTLAAAGVSAVGHTHTYLDATSSIQTQLNGKQATISGWTGTFDIGATRYTVTNGIIVSAGAF